MKRASLMLTLTAMFLAPALSPLSLGCGLQGEGQRCDVNNNPNDCDVGLGCRSRAELGGNSDICCPLNDDAVSWSVHTISPDCKPKGNTGASSSSSSSGSGSSSSSGSGTGGASGSSSSSSASSSSASSSSSGGQDAGAG